MKNLILIVSLLMLAGCGSLYTKTTDPATGKVTYPISDSTSNTLYQIGEGIKAVPSGFPYADLAKLIATGGLGLFAGGLTLWGRVKEQKAAADLLAATVVKSGQQSTALQVASGTAAYAQVAQHLDNNSV